MQLLHAAAKDRNADWRTHVRPVEVRPRGSQQDCTLSFIPSGVSAPDYADWLPKQFDPLQILEQLS